MPPPDRAEVPPNDVRVAVPCFDRGRQSGQAAADDQDVGLPVLMGGGFLDNRGLQGLDVRAGLGQGGFGGLEDGVRGVGRAGHGVYREGLIFHDGLGDRLQGWIRHAGRFAVVRYGDGQDFVSADLDRDRDVSVISFGRSGILAFCIAGRKSAGHQAERQHQG